MDLGWKDQPKNMGNPLHTMCSYMAMFPPSLPHYFIEKYSSKGNVVLDPFSGRGTTALEACLNDRIGIGSDRNPLAYVLTSSKVNVPSKNRIISRIDVLQKNFNPDEWDLSEVKNDIRMIFSDNTLSQLLYLKSKLNWKTSNVDAFITSMVLGILHGGSMGYLSLQMPNTFSMSPDYIRKYVEKNGLTRPNRDAFSLLKRKLYRCYQKVEKRGKVYASDARRLAKIKDGSVDLVVTSPPYTRLITYGKFNWIRLWFLGKESRDVEDKLFTTQSISRYENFMSKVLSEMVRVTAPGGKIVLVVGDVPGKDNKMVNLAQLIWEKCAQNLDVRKIEEIHEDVIRDSSKVSRIWGNERLKISSKSDRILVLEKI